MPTALQHRGERHAPAARRLGDGLRPPEPLRIPERLGVTLPGMRFVPAGPSLWRVVGAGGLVLGHIERTTAEHGERFAARRLPHGASRSVPLGEFWSARDAAECFR
ncbi:hypothetical protein [Agromyces archimandritae]|uniref:Uncharacterized protein n=1 Tax=Agromyces archimandritae TaxID=2781962 RepID=A0A975IQ03_9MICO|nr:hypothetical protein [Agromyces archimandritae]QTX04536.1 hypothetical protein G127AT_14940 [Agromyces archimandritae]